MDARTGMGLVLPLFFVALTAMACGLLGVALRRAGDRLSLSRPASVATAVAGVLPLVWVGLLAVLVAQVRFETGDWPREQTLGFVDGHLGYVGGPGPDEFFLGWIVFFTLLAAVLTPLVFVPLAIARWGRAAGVGTLSAVWTAGTALVWVHLVVDPGGLNRWFGN